LPNFVINLSSKIKSIFQNQKTLSLRFFQTGKDGSSVGVKQSTDEILFKKHQTSFLVDHKI
jgi:hypothetical protein